MKRNEKDPPMWQPQTKEHWQGLASVAFSGVIEWRLTHPTSTWAEIETTIDQRFAGVRARKLAEATLADGRALAILLTAEGRWFADRAAGWSDFLLAAVDDLTPTEQQVMPRALVKMIRRLQARGEIPISRMCVTCRYFQPRVHPDPDRSHHCAFVDEAFGDRQLRLECIDHVTAAPAQVAAIWSAFAGAAVSE